METEQKPTQETHPDESHVSAAGGDEAVTETAVDPLAIINEITGREYKDLDAAKKSIKDWQVGASQAQNLRSENEVLKNAPQTDEDLRAAVAKLTQQVGETATDAFFAQNPDHASNRVLLEKIAKADGITVAEAANSDTYKPVFEAVQTASEVQSKKTVAQSNNRVNQSVAPNEMPAPGDKDAAGRFVAENFFKTK